jgi:hypothetical protein
MIGSLKKWMTGLPKDPIMFRAAIVAGLRRVTP